MIDNRSKSKIDAWPYAKRPVSGVQCPVPKIGGSVTFLPDTGHQTIPSNLALCQGGGYFV